MSCVKRLSPGEVMARVSFESCFLAKPRRAMPSDVGRWARALPVPAALAAAGLAAPLRGAVSPLWDAWLARFRQGLRIEREGADRVVVHCDTMRYRVTSLGKIHAFIPTLDGRYEPCQVEIGNPFFSWGWARILAEREPAALAPLRQSILVRRLAGLLPAGVRPAEIERQCIDWLLDVVQGLARRAIDGQRMRRLLREALAPEPQLLLAARRARPAFARDIDVGSAWWNLCVEHAGPLKELQRIAPGLLPLYGLHMHDGTINRFRLDMRDLRKPLQALGLKPADWKRLLARRARPVWQMHQDRVIRSRGALLAFLVDWTRVHRGLPGGLWMPRAMWEPLARTYVGPEADHALPPIRWPGTPAATREAIIRYREAQAAGRGNDFIEHEWGRVVRWAGNYDGNGDRAPVRRWSTARRLAAAHERTVAARLAGDRWQAPLATFEGRKLLAVAVTTGEALAEEAIVMRHCADRFAFQCANGSLAIYSIRCRQTGRRLATASIELSARGARLAEISRSLNREASAAEKAFARKLVLQVGLAVASTTSKCPDLTDGGSETLLPAGS